MAVPPPTPHPAPDATARAAKAMVRAAVRQARDNHVGQSSPGLAAPPEFLALLRPGLAVAGYIPLGSEASPATLLAAASAAGCRIALPHVTSRRAPMRFLEWMLGSPLHDGMLGLSQPPADAPELAPDIILTPLLAFDTDLNRLGQGAGFYDRAFATFPDAIRIGIAWSVQQIAQVPVDAWDVPLNAIITEKGWMTR